MATALPHFPPFDVHGDEGNAASRWKKWLERFDNLLVAMAVTDKPRKKALLLHYAGPDVHEIFSTLTLAAEGDDVYKKACDALNSYFEPKVNKEFEIFKISHGKTKFW